MTDRHTDIHDIHIYATSRRIQIVINFESKTEQKISCPSDFEDLSQAVEKFSDTGPILGNFR